MAQPRSRGKTLPGQDTDPKGTPSTSGGADTAPETADQPAQVHPDDGPAASGAPVAEQGTPKVVLATSGKADGTGPQDRALKGQAPKASDTSTPDGVTGNAPLPPRPAKATGARDGATTSDQSQGSEAKPDDNKTQAKKGQGARSKGNADQGNKGQDNKAQGNQGQGKAQGNKGQDNKGQGNKQKAAPARKEKKAEDTDTKPQVQFKPVASPARMHRRHYGLIASFFIVVFIPIIIVAIYMYTFAQDQYASTAGFTVRAEEGGAATDLLGGLAQFAGGGTGGDADILFEFIASQEIVQRLNDDFDLAAHYSAPYDEDPFFALQPDASIEALVSHWREIVRVSFEQSTGLIELRVLAFEPQMAHDIAQAIIAESQVLVNELNAQARADSMRFAETDLEAAIGRLRTAREALTEFRTRTQIVDPASDLQGRMVVLNNLQQQLAEALIEFDLLSETAASPTDPRMVQAARRIDVIRSRIAQERQTFTLDDVGANGQDYPTLMAEFEGLVVDREFAEESYRAALTAVDVARTNTARQSRYLAVFIQPTMPESAGFPRRDLMVALTAMFSFLAWAIMALVFYSIRDRQ